MAAFACWPAKRSMNSSRTCPGNRSWSWFNRAVANAGTTATNVLVLGTALHRDCLVLRLSRTAGWQGHVFRAIERWPQRMDLWQEWQALYQDYGLRSSET